MVTNTPVPGWYQDPEMAGRLRYWDGSQWTEHLAAAPAPVAAYQIPSAPTTFYQPQGQQHTLYSNPYQLPPRTPRRVAEDALSNQGRVWAALLDAAMIIPFILIGFFLAPVLSWASGDAGAKNHAYYGAALVLALALGISFVFWNFVIRETTLGTDVMSRRRKTPADAVEQDPH